MIQNDTNLTFIGKTVKSSNKFLNVWGANIEDIGEISNFVSGERFADYIKQYASDTKTFINSIRVFPFATTASAEKVPCAVGELVINKQDGTNLEMPLISDKIRRISFLLNLDTTSGIAYFNNFLDYEPYTKYSLYLPYFGDIDLDSRFLTPLYDTAPLPTIQVEYYVNLATGDTTVYVLSKRRYPKPSIQESIQTIYSADGVIGEEITFGMTNAGDMKAQAILNGINGTLKTLGLSSSMFSMAKAPSGKGKEFIPGIKGVGLASMGATAAVGVLETMHSVADNPVSATAIGQTTGLSGFAAYNKPILKIYHPNVQRPEDYSHYEGNAVCVTRTIGDINSISGEYTNKGYFEIGAIHLEGESFKGTLDSEKQQIVKLLQGGVILPTSPTAI